MTARMMWGLFALMLACASSMPTITLALAEDRDRGRDLAVTHCSRCHVIPLHNPFGGIGSTPSFNLLANMDDGLERFQTFFARRPHPNFVRVPGVEPLTAQPATLEPFDLEPEDIDALVAYAKALRNARD